MRSTLKQFAVGNGWSRGLAAVLLAIWLCLTLVAASPELHRALHSDAQHADHHCCITLLAQGHIDVPVCYILISQAPAPCSHTTPFLLSVPGNGVEFLPPGRAPPLFS